MTRTLLGSLVVGLALLIVQPKRVHAEIEQAAPPTGNAPFAFDLFSRLGSSGPDKRTIGNLAFSPYSIEAAFAVAGSGARGDTAAEIAHVFHSAPGADDPLVTDFEARVAKLQAEGSIHLATANGLWVGSQISLLDAFVARAKERFHAEIRAADFEHAAEKARQDINSWVSGVTRGKIPELISKGVLQAATSLVIVNAFYFKGDWDSPFEKEATVSGDFHTADGRTLQVPQMSQAHMFGYAENTAAQLLDLPYLGGSISMILVLPKAKDGLQALEQSLTAESFSALLQSAARARVLVTLPKFTIRTSLNLADVLKSLGIHAAFEYPQADFSGIEARRLLYISQVIHQTFVETDEKGTEAAAATAIVMRAGSAMMAQKSVEFTADHPFLFFLRERQTGAILLMGRVADPSR